MFTDSHCHLASWKYDTEEIPYLIKRAEKAGVHRMITLSTELDDLAPNIALSENYSSIFTCIGIHPCDVTNAPDNALAQLADSVKKHHIAAIGETGLDYYHPAPKDWSEEAYHQRQRDFLEKHFQLAAENNLNIALHTRDQKGTASFNDCMMIYEKYATEIRAVFHCFPGTIEQAKRIINLGGLVSFTGNVTFKNAKQIQETASALPLGTFMLETDAPYLAPVPHRGQRNEPAYVSEIAAQICHLKNVSLAELSKATEGAVEEFFSLSV